MYMYIVHALYTQVCRDYCKIFLETLTQLWTHCSAINEALRVIIHAHMMELCMYMYVHTMHGFVSTRKVVACDRSM